MISKNISKLDSFSALPPMRIQEIKVSS